MRLLLFDVDGTLIHSHGLGRRALDQAFQERYGWEDATRDVSFLGSTDPWILEEVFQRHGRDPALAPAEQEGFFARYVELLAAEAASASVRVLPGVTALLEHLRGRADCALGLLTGNVREGARLKLEPAGLWDYFPWGAFGEDAPTRPGLLPVALGRAQRALGRAFAAEDVVVIGDTARDIEVGRVHGARAVAVASGWVSRQDLAQHAPDALLDDLDDLEQALAALLG